MADTLITKLSNSREIIVSSLNSVRKYVDLDQDPLAAGRSYRSVPCSKAMSRNRAIESG